MIGLGPGINCIFAMTDHGYGEPWIWRPLAMTEGYLNKFGLEPLQTSDQSTE